MNNFPARTNYLLPTQSLGRAERLMNFKSCDFFPVGEFTNSIMAIVCQVSNNYEDLKMDSRPKLTQHRMSRDVVMSV